jgi:hypothetical protein
VPRKPAHLVVLASMFLLAAVPALAAPVPVPLPADFPQHLVVRDFGIDLEPACHAIYLDESASTGFYFPAGPGIEVADDLHTTLTESQAICGFDFGYYNPGAGQVTATVTVYANTEFDSDKGAPIAGPYVVHGLPPGANAFHIDVVGGTVLPHVWLGVAFDDGVTGLLSFGPPTLGSTHDTLWLTPPGAAGNFGGQPSADVFLGLYSSPSTPAQPSSWGSLKALYR